ncbi:MAG: hypothetical protein D6776_05985, partial [Planctomycetota bacterium]
YITTPGSVLASGTTLSDGSFGRIPLGKFKGAVVVRSVGGLFLDPATGATVALSAAVNGGVAESEWNALIAIDPKTDFGGLTLSPLSRIATAVGIGLAEYTGRGREHVAVRAHRDVSLYFGDDPVLVPRARGTVLWDTSAPLASTPTAIDRNIALGLIVAGLSVRAAARGQDLESYTDELFLDAVDGCVDGVLHPPAASSVSKIGTANYPDDPLGLTLATDIETFLNGPTNASGITVAQAQSFLSRIAGGGGQLVPELPRIEQVVAPLVPGQREVTIRGTRFARGAQVWFGSTAAPFVVVEGGTQIRAELPAGFVSGSTVFVTVQNPDGLRHSVEVTITLP